MMQAKKLDLNEISVLGSYIPMTKDTANNESVWHGVGVKVGVKVWRLEQFKVCHWPKEKYGTFYDGDTYIILNTHKEADSEELKYDIHFWIGTYCTQEEFGTAFNKACELDTLLDSKATQHREVQGQETPLLKSYFKDFRIMKGGVKTGLRKVSYEKYTARLFRWCATNNDVKMKEVPLKRSSLDESGVFILNAEKRIYQWNGKDSSSLEKLEALMYCNNLSKEQIALLEVYDGTEMLQNKSFHKIMKQYEEKKVDEQDEPITNAPHSRKLFKLSDASGSFEMLLIGEGKSISRDMLSSDDVFIFEVPSRYFIWIGDNASRQEKKLNAISSVCKYLSKTACPNKPIALISERVKNDAFNAALDG